MDEEAVLQAIETDREISMNTDSEFLYEYQKSMLLALKEIGTLNEMQYRYAEQTLKKQKQEFIKKICHTETGGGTNNKSSKLLSCFNGQSRPGQFL